MGNCIGKKSSFGRHRRVPSNSTDHSQNNGRSSTKLISTFVFPVPSACDQLISLSKEGNIFLSSLSNTKETGFVLSHIHNSENERKFIQSSSSTTNDELTLVSSQPSITSIRLSSSEYKKCKSNDATPTSLNENHIKQSFTLIINDEDRKTMGQFFNKEKDTNKDNIRRNNVENLNIDIKVHENESEKRKHDDQYFTIITEQEMSNIDTMVNVNEIVQESLDTSPSSSLFDSSLSSVSRNTTPFSSQDRLILSSSASSSSSVVLSPISSIAIVPHCQISRLNKIHSSTFSHGSRSLTYAEQIYFHDRSFNHFPCNDIFSSKLPVCSSRQANDGFLSEFHQNILLHHFTTLKTVVDNVLQQQFLRIHRSCQVILIEHQQLDCVHLKDVKKFDAPTLIFDEKEKRVHITKHARFVGLQSLTCTSDQVARLPKLFSSCDHCSNLFSPSKLNQRLRAFFLVNITHNLVEQCFNETNNNTVFGYVSQEHPTEIRQIMLNNGKLNYSYDLDIYEKRFLFVLRLNSWPENIRQPYEQRSRLWPIDTETLFDGTCFIRFDRVEQELSTTEKCSACEKFLSSPSNSSWSYSYAAIENKFISLMNNEQIRFASIMWNYFNGKTQGELPFVVFKHSLFYFFEQFSSDVFITSDLISHANLFTDLLFNRLQTKSIPHYFNSNHNLYNENLASISVQLISMKMTYSDLKHFCVYLQPKSFPSLYHWMYLIEFQSQFLQSLLACESSKSNSLQTILDTDQAVIKQLSSGIRTYKRQLEAINVTKMFRTLTLECLYAYQERNVQIILDYLPLLREKEPSLLIHSLWSTFIQYFNCLFDDLLNCKN